MDIAVRRPGAGEIDELATLDYGIFGEPGYSVVSIRQFYDLAGPLLKVAVRGGELVGYCLVLPSYDGVSGWFMSLGVRADCRQRGVGRELTRAVLADADRTPLRELRLTVLPDNAGAIGLYESTGFVSEGVAADFFGRGSDRLVMVRRRR